MELPLVLMSPKPAGDWRVFTFNCHFNYFLTHFTFESLGTDLNNMFHVMWILPFYPFIAFHHSIMSRSVSVKSLFPKIFSLVTVMLWHGSDTFYLCVLWTTANWNKGLLSSGEVTTDSLHFTLPIISRATLHIFSNKYIIWLLQS